MSTLLFTVISGWLLTSIFAGTALLPWAVKRNPRSMFRWHFLIGYALPALALAHTWPFMARGWAGRVNSTGLYAATLAFLLLFLQLGIGLQLRKMRGRAQLRRIHFAGMAAIAGLILVHISLNSIMVGPWLPS